MFLISIVTVFLCIICSNVKINNTTKESEPAILPPAIRSSTLAGIRVAVLNDPTSPAPSYFVGSPSNDYSGMVTWLTSNGANATSVTSAQVAAGVLANYDVFALIDNAPPATAETAIVKAWKNGLNILSFDSSICVLNYFGILPLVANGTSGSGNNVYWDYSATSSTRIVTAHPITANNSVGSIITGTAGDAEWISAAMNGTAEKSKITVLGVDNSNPSKWTIMLYQPSGGAGNVFHVWDNLQVANVALRPIVYNAINFIVQRSSPSLTKPKVTPAAGNPTTIFSFNVLFSTASNSPPTSINVTINGTNYGMSKQNSSATNYNTGVQYTYSTTLPAGMYSYSFSASSYGKVNTTATFSNLTVTAGNHVPQLLFPKVSPTAGTNATSFNFTVQYFDASNVIPTAINVTLNGTGGTHVMTATNSGDTNTRDGKQYSSSFALTWGLYKFRVNCSDGTFVNGTSWIIGPAVTPFLANSNYTLFYDDFESGLGKWSYVSGFWHITSDQTNIWADGLPWSQPHSPTHAAWFGQEATGNYNNGSRAYGNMISIPINLQGITKATLEFYHWRNGESPTNTSTWDESFVYISPNNGTTWHLIYSNAGNVAAWNRVDLDISAYCGNPAVRLRFFFDTVDSVSNTYRGWIVDDVKIFSNATTGKLNLLNPINSATVYDGNVNFTWSSLQIPFGSINYTWQLSNRSDFATVTRTVSGILQTITTTSKVILVNVTTGTYYWRVKPFSGIYSGNWSAPFVINEIRDDFAPRLTSGTVSPGSGNQFQSFTFSTVYSDKDNNTPSTITVVINGTVHPMVKQNPLNNNYVGGVTYQYVTTFVHVTGTYRFYFNCTSGRYANVTQTYSGPIVTESNVNIPRLTAAMVSPVTGLNTTMYNFSVVYTDADDNYPMVITVTINASTYGMVAAVPLDTNVMDGKSYYYTTTLGAWGTYRFRMNCSDGLHVNVTSWVTNPFVNPFFGAPTVTLNGPLTGASVFNGLISFNWTSSGAFVGGTTYAWQFSNTSGFTSLLKQVTGIPAPSGLTNRQINVQAATGTYYWRVHPVNGNFNGTWTAPNTLNIIFNNNTPQIKSPGVTPLTGSQLTAFNFTMQYWDADNNAPTYVRVTINGTSYAMTKANPADITYTDGCTYKYVTMLPIGLSSYTFSCSDGKYSNVTSASSITVTEVNNFPPKILNAKVTPTIGTNMTSFNFTATYQDADNNQPRAMNITINGSTYNMVKVNPSATNATAGIQYTYVTTLTWGYFIFQVRCFDGKYSNATAWLSGPTVNPFSSLGTGTITKVAIFQDSDAWGFASTEQILTAHGIPYTIYSYTSLGVVSLASFTKVIISSVQDSSFYTALTSPATLTWLQNYVTSGGILEIHGATQGSPSPLSLPFGLSSIYSTTNALTINASYKTNPMVVGYTNAGLANWGSSAHCYISGLTSADAHIIYDNSSLYPRLATAYRGSGMLILTGMTLEYAYGNSKSTILQSIVLYDGLSSGTINLLTPLNNSIVQSGNINFTWSSLSSPAGMLNYTWQISNSSSFTSILKQVSGIPAQTGSTSSIINATLPTRAYYWRVRATYGVFSSNWSAPFLLSIILNTHPPKLLSPGVNPPTGSQITSFNFTVTYSDADNNTPSYVRVIINGTTITMTKSTPSQNNYITGVTYKYVTTEPIGVLTYSFTCNDGKFTNTTTTFSLTVAQLFNNPPKILNAMVSPVRGSNSTSFNFTATYQSQDNNMPLNMNITINSLTYNMVKVNPLATNATKGIQYMYVTTLAYGNYTFQMHCFDGKFSNATAVINNPRVGPFYVGVPTITLVSPTNGATSFNGLTWFNWTASGAFAGGTTYTWQLSNTTTFTSVLMQVTGIPAPAGMTSRQINVAQPNGAYYWRVRPVNGIFNGNWTAYFLLNLLYNNYSPQLKFPGVNPPTGNQFTTFNFTVQYSDADNNTPAYVRVTINGTAYSMVKANPGNNNYLVGCLFKYMTTLPIGLSIYSYSCSDGKFLNSTSVLSVTVTEQNNFPPNILNAKVTPTIGTNTTSFNFTATYQDADNNQPRAMNITINGTTYNMVKVIPSATNAIAGIQYTYVTTLTWGYYIFKVRCFDGKFANATTWISAPTVNPFLSTGSGTIKKVAIFENNLPWGDNVTMPRMVALGIKYTLFTSASFGVVSLAGYDKVYIESQQTTAFYTALTQPSVRAWLEAYVSGGGIFEMNNMHYTSDSISGTLPGGYTEYNAQTGVDSIMINASWASSPLVAGCTSAGLSSWGSSTYQYLQGMTGTESRIVYDNSSYQPRVFTRQFGNGMLVYNALVVEWAVNHGYGTSSAFLTDLISYAGTGVKNIQLLTPANNSIVQSGNINFTWTSLGLTAGKSNYTWQMSNTPTFSSILLQATNIPEHKTTSWDVIAVNLPSGNYYWRVKPTFLVFSGNWTSPFRLILNSTTYPFNIISSIAYRSGNGTYIGGTTFVVRVVYKNPGTTALTGVQTLLTYGGYTFLSTNASGSITVPANNVTTFQDFLVSVAIAATSQNPVVINATWSGVRNDTSATVSGNAGTHVVNVGIKAQANLQVTRIVFLTGNGTYVAGTTFKVRVDFSNPVASAKANNVGATLVYGGYSSLSSNTSTLVTISGTGSIYFLISISNAATSGTVTINANFAGTEEISGRVLAGTSAIGLSVAIQSLASIIIDSVVVNATQPKPGGWVLVTVSVRNTGGTSVSNGVVKLIFNSTFAMLPTPVNSSTGLYIGANGHIGVMIRFQVSASIANNTFMLISANFTGTESISGRNIYVPGAAVNATIKAVSQPFSVSITILGGRLSYIQGIDTFTVRATIDNTGGSLTVTGTLGLNFLGGAVNYNVNASYSGISVPVGNILVKDFKVVVSSTATLGSVSIQATITLGTNKNSNVISINTYSQASVAITSITYHNSNGIYVGGMNFTIRVMYSNAGTTNANAINVQTTLSFGGFAGMSGNLTGSITVPASGSAYEDFIITVASGATTQNPVTISATWTGSEQYSGRPLNGNSIGSNLNVAIKAKANLQITAINYLTGNSTYVAGMNLVVRVSLSNPATAAVVNNVMTTLSFNGASGLSSNGSSLIAVSGSLHVDFLVTIATGTLSQNPVIISVTCAGTEEISNRLLNVNSGNANISISIKAQSNLQITSITYINGTGTYVAGMKFVVRVALSNPAQAAKALGATIVLYFGGYLALSYNISASKTISGNNHIDLLITVLQPTLAYNIVTITAFCSGIEEISGRSLNIASASSLIVFIIDQPPTVQSKPSDISVSQGTQDISLLWMLHSGNPGYYSITRNGTAIAVSKPWTSNVTILVDTTVALGIYIYNLTYTDSIGNPGIPSIVRVTILQDVPPFVVSSPRNMTVTQGASGVLMIWILHGGSSGYYSITRNGTAIVTSKSWSSNVTLLIDTTVAPGVYVYELTYTDGIGIYGIPSFVRVTILAPANQGLGIFGQLWFLVLVIVGVGAVVAIVAAVGASKKKKVVKLGMESKMVTKGKAGKQIAQPSWVQPAATTTMLTLEEVKSRLKHLFVFHKSGVCLFYQPFTELSIDPQLIAGFISAISSFGETFEKEARLKVLEYQSFKILLQESVVCKYALLFTGDLNPKLSELLNTFIGEFESKFRVSLSEFNGNISMFTMASEIMNNVFKMPVSAENIALKVGTIAKQPEPSPAVTMPFNLYCPLCEQWTVKPGNYRVTGSETCPKCNQSLYFVPKCDNCGNGFVKPVTEFNAFKNSSQVCEKCGNKMRIQ